MSDNWRLTLPCTRQEAEALYDADEILSAMVPQPSIVTQELEAFNDAKWEMLAYFDGKPANNIIEQIRALIPSASNAIPLLESLPDEDWLTMSQQALEPVRAGRFYVHTSQNAGKIPESAVPFRIDAGQAFGTGGHETTSGCLAMLDYLKRRGKRFDMIADIGTGTGLLAFAALILWPRAYTTASDIDPVSIGVTTLNAAANNIALGQSPRQLALCVATGTDHELIQRRAPFDLVIANILAAPLIEMAPAIAEIIQEGGTLILAGLLDTQADAVVAAYRKLGFRLEQRMDTGDWPCLRLAKRRKYGWQRPIRSDGRTSQPPGDFGTW
jgi:ribosomal protein L11 methyltransferase